MVKSAGITAAMAMILTACASPGGTEQTAGSATSALLTVPAAICNAERHRCVTVTVTPSSGSNPAKIDPVDDQYFQDDNHVVFWTLAGTYTFPNDGIKIVEVSPLPGVDVPPKGEFTCRPAFSGHVFFCINRHSVGSSATPKKYKYTIKVNGVAAPLDPFMVNN